jgi:DNA-binding HxlR family transcriptional regulator
MSDPANRPPRPSPLGKELPRMSEVGRTIYKIVKEQPGIHFRGLGRAANLTSAGQLRHHLDRLERQGLLVELEDGRYKRFFVAGDHDRTLRPGLARFARLVPRKIGKLLLVHPMNRTELRRSLGCADSTLGYHLKRMMEQGDLEKHRGRNCCKYSLTSPELVQKVLMLQGTEMDWGEEAEEAEATLPRLGSPLPTAPGLAPDPDDEPPEPAPGKPEPFEPVQVLHDLGPPAPEVVPRYLVDEPEPGEPEPPLDPEPAPEPQPAPPTSIESEQKVQEP